MRGVETALTSSASEPDVGRAQAPSSLVEQLRQHHSKSPLSDEQPRLSFQEPSKPRVSLADRQATQQAQPPGEDRGSGQAEESWAVDIPESEIEFDEVDDVIGMGGQGVVYQAQWHRTTVAVKKVMIDPSEEGGKSKIDRKNIADLRKESQVLAGLRHPHILLFLGCHFRAPAFYMVTELVVGPNGHHNMRQVLSDKSLQPSLVSAASRVVCSTAMHLRILLTKSRFWAAKKDWGLRLRMLEDIALAGAFLHQRGTLHRDLKSPNVLVTEAFRCKIGDFGLSRLDVLALKRQPMDAKRHPRDDDGPKKLTRTLTRKYNVSAIIPPEVMAGVSQPRVLCFSFC